MNIQGYGTFPLHGIGTRDGTENRTGNNGLHRTVHTTPGPGVGPDPLSPILPFPFPVPVSFPYTVNVTLRGTHTGIDKSSIDQSAFVCLHQQAVIFFSRYLTEFSTAKLFGYFCSFLRYHLLADLEQQNFR